MILRRFISSCLMLTLIFGVSAAQRPEVPVTEADKARDAAERRVEADMVKMNNLAEALAKNLGQLHYLRTLCFGDEDQKWREYASKMMNLEAGPDAAKKRNLVRAFNVGYYQEKERFETCSQSVSVDAAALAENGRHIASMLGDPYREN